MTTKMKTRGRDMHKAYKALKRLVAKRLKLRRAFPEVLDSSFIEHKYYGRFTFKGNPLKLREPFEAKGFVVDMKPAADQRRMRLTKEFTTQGRIFTARVTIYPEMNRVIISAKIAAEPALL